MTPAATTFGLTGFATAHIDCAVIVTSIAMFALNLLLMVVIDRFRCHIYSVISHNSGHRLKWICLHPLSSGCCLLLIVVENLLTHCRSLSAHGVDLLLHIPAPGDTPGTIIKKIIALSACWGDTGESHCDSEDEFRYSFHYRIPCFVSGATFRFVICPLCRQAWRSNPPIKKIQEIL